MENQPQHQQEPSFFAKANAWAKNSITLKLVIIGILILVMLIPVNMVESLIWERSNRKDLAYAEVSNTWGGSQTIGGPILVVPIELDTRVTSTDEEGRETTKILTTTSYVSILPDVLTYDAALDSETKKRGIYELILYQGKVGLEGSFPQPNPNDLEPDARVLWDRATVAITISELKALKEQVQLTFGEQELEFKPGKDIANSFGVAVHAKVDLTPYKDGPIPFSGMLEFRGSRSLSMLPLGKETEANVTSDWNSPKFYGDFLPDTSNYDTSGLAGHWKVLDLNRNYPQVFEGAVGITGNSFGVELYQKLDHYALNERAAKYAVLMIALIFLAFFFMQIIFKRRIHAIQFLLVGLSLTLFYTLLLSLSEQVGFDKAYALSALAILGLNMMYIKAIFEKWKPALIGGAIIAVLYVFIFVILQMEEYALLTGSIGLFLLVGYAMYLTKNVERLTRGDSES